MRILLDTHTFLWLITDRDRLPPAVGRILSDPEHEVSFSSVTSWEIATKRAKGKIVFEGSPIELARKLQLRIVPITGEHCEWAAELPWHHTDPFDRLLVAQAALEGMVIATHDRAIARYGAKILAV